MLDHTLHRVRIAGEPRIVDLGIKNGRIAAIEPELPPGEQSIDAEGRLVVPGFVESHIHLDKACILDRCSHQGGLEQAIAEVGRLKAEFSIEDVAERAGQALRRCILHGTTRMRTHVEIDPKIGLRGLEGVRAAIDAHRSAIDVELCVFPQEGLLNYPGTEELLVQALRQGVPVIGGAPYADSDSHGQIDRIFELTREFACQVDLHLDFGDSDSALDIEHVCRRTEQYGLGGKVTVGHASKFARLPAPAFDALARRLADCGIAVTVLPATDLFLMHRNHDQARDIDPKRGVAPLHRMIGLGVNGALSTNNMLNPFTPFGDGSLLRMANLFANIAQLGRPQELALCLELITRRPAALMNLTDYGIAHGHPADLVLLDATDPAMAVATLAPPILGFKAGRQTFHRPLPKLMAETDSLSAPA
jgi:cytosine deaminase